MNDSYQPTYVEPPVAGTEAATLLGSLGRQRAIFAWKCDGLDAAGLSATTAASSLTLGGLIKHLALVEDDMFSSKLFGRDPQPPWDEVDWEATPDWEFETAAQDSPEQLMALWRESVARSVALTEEALADGGLDHLATGVTGRDGQAPSLRRLLIDMIEEYARHIGHADIIRESVDGLVGEEPEH